jgi:hypothetical protein
MGAQPSILQYSMNEYFQTLCNITALKHFKFYCRRRKQTITTPDLLPIIITPFSASVLSTLRSPLFLTHPSVLFNLPWSPRAYTGT